MDEMCRTSRYWLAIAHVVRVCGEKHGQSSSCSRITGEAANIVHMTRLILSMSRFGILTKDCDRLRLFR